MQQALGKQAMVVSGVAQRPEADGMTLQKLWGRPSWLAGNANRKVTKCMQCTYRQQWSGVKGTGSVQEVMAMHWTRNATAELPAVDAVVTCSIPAKNVHE